MRQNRSKRLISARASEKKIKSHKKVTFHLFAQKSPVNDFFTKLGTNVPLVDIIKCDKFCNNLFKGLYFTGGQTSKFPHRKLTQPVIWGGVF